MKEYWHELVLVLQNNIGSELFIYCRLHLLDILADVEVVTVTSYWAPGFRWRIMTLFSVQGTVIVPPSCLFLTKVVTLYVMT